jgi:MFS family permease
MSKLDSETNTNTDKQHQVRWLTLFVLGLSLFAGGVDSSVMNVVTPAIMEEFNTSESQIVILVTIYSLVTASFLLLFGKIGSKYGLRLLQASGMALFGLASLMIALAPSLWFMSGMRALLVWLLPWSALPVWLWSTVSSRAGIVSWLSAYGARPVALDLLLGLCLEAWLSPISPGVWLF